MPKQYNFIFTINDTISLMHQDSASGFRAIADWAERNDVPSEEIIKFLREMADEKEAQAMVVELRDEL